jgi:DNA-binding YbaB/EbfC family protein
MSAGGEMPFDLGTLIGQLGEVQHNLAEAQRAAAAEVVEGSAGGGAVRVTLTGAFEFESVTIAPSVVDPQDVEMLQDLVLAAIRDGIEKAAELASDAIGAAGMGSLPGLGGMPGLGDLGGLFGSQ